MASVANIALTALLSALCGIGILLSCLGVSGTWFVVGASLLAMIIRSDPFPGLVTVAAFISISILVEIVEAVAGSWGVIRRGGSWMAGVAAFVGGVAGAIIGSLIPVLFVGSIVGMIIGSFALVFAVEALRLKKTGQAAGIAWGTVMARVIVIFVKVAVTMGMTVYLIGRIVMG